jgi:uncharacterized membrane protein
MKHRHFFERLDKERLSEAIRLTESSGRIAITLFISHKMVEEPLAAAEKEFARIRKKQRNPHPTLLIFIAPQSKKFAILGSPELHAKVGQKRWNEWSDLLSNHFRQEQYTDGLIAMLGAVRNALQT